MESRKRILTVRPFPVDGSRVVASQYDNDPNCFVVNRDRTERMSCHASLLPALVSQSRHWFGGNSDGEIVLERNGEFVKDNEFLELDVDDHFMYVTKKDEWTPNDGKVDLASIRPEQFHVIKREKVRERRPVPEKIMNIYRSMAKNDAYKKKGPWKGMDETDLEEMTCVDMESLIEVIDEEKVIAIQMKATDLLFRIYQKEDDEDNEFWSDHEGPMAYDEDEDSDEESDNTVIRPSVIV